MNLKAITLFSNFTLKNVTQALFKIFFKPSIWLRDES